MTTVAKASTRGRPWWRKAVCLAAASVSAGLTDDLGRCHGPAGTRRRSGRRVHGPGRKDLMAAARSRSPGMMAAVVERHGDVAQIGLYSLGEYRTRLAQAERPSYYSGMARFIGRYAATEAPKYPVARVEWSNQSVRGVVGPDGRQPGRAGGRLGLRRALAALQVRQQLQGARCHGARLLDDAVPQEACSRTTSPRTAATRARSPPH